MGKGGKEDSRRAAGGAGREPGHGLWGDIKSAYRAYEAVFRRRWVTARPLDCEVGV